MLKNLRKKINEKKKKKGFTLIELIIVIAIIAILAAVAIPKFGAIKESANKKADVANAKNIHTAVTTEKAQKPGVVVNSAAAIQGRGDANIGGLIEKWEVGKTAAVVNQEFMVYADAAGDIHVTLNSIEVYPNTAATFN